MVQLSKIVVARCVATVLNLLKYFSQSKPRSRLWWASRDEVCFLRRTLIGLQPAWVMCNIVVVQLHSLQPCSLLNFYIYAKCQHNRITQHTEAHVSTSETSKDPSLEINVARDRRGFTSKDGLWSVCHLPGWCATSYFTPCNTAPMRARCIFTFMSKVNTTESSNTLSPCIDIEKV